MQSPPCQGKKTPDCPRLLWLMMILLLEVVAVVLVQFIIDDNEDVANGRKS